MYEFGKISESYYFYKMIVYMQTQILQQGNRYKWRYEGQASKIQTEFIFIIIFLSSYCASTIFLADSEACTR